MGFLFISVHMSDLTVTNILFSRKYKTEFLVEFTGFTMFSCWISLEREILLPEQQVATWKLLFVLASLWKRRKAAMCV